jgi:hypothetical protein
VHGAALQLDASAAVKVWREAILDVHKEYFEENERWARKLCLPVRCHCVQVVARMLMLMRCVC